MRSPWLWRWRPVEQRKCAFFFLSATIIALASAQMKSIYFLVSGAEKQTCGSFGSPPLLCGSYRNNQVITITPLLRKAFLFVLHVIIDTLPGYVFECCLCLNTKLWFCSSDQTKLDSRTNSY